MAKKTGKQPKALAGVPEISIVGLDYLDAFDSLSVSRTDYNKPLSIADIKAYFDGSEMFGDFTEFLTIVQHTDRAYVEGIKK